MAPRPACCPSLVPVMLLLLLAAVMSRTALSIPQWMPILRAHEQDRCFLDIVRRTWNSLTPCQMFPFTCMDCILPTPCEYRGGEWQCRGDFNGLAVLATIRYRCNSTRAVYGGIQCRNTPETPWSQDFPHLAKVYVNRSVGCQNVLCDSL